MPIMPSSLSSLPYCNPKSGRVRPEKFLHTPHMHCLHCKLERKKRQIFACNPLVRILLCILTAKVDPANLIGCSPHILCRPALPPSPPSPAGIRRCPPETHNSTEDKEGRAGEGEHPREEETDKSRGSKKEKAPPPTSSRAVLLRATVSDLAGEGDSVDDSVKLHPGHTLVVAVSVSKNMALVAYFALFLPAALSTFLPPHSPSTSYLPYFTL